MAETKSLFTSATLHKDDYTNLRRNVWDGAPLQRIKWLSCGDDKPHDAGLFREGTPPLPPSTCLY
jgi:hypothetical protein